MSLLGKELYCSQVVASSTAYRAVVSLSNAERTCQTMLPGMPRLQIG